MYLQPLDLSFKPQCYNMEEEELLEQPKKEKKDKKKDKEKKSSRTVETMYRTTMANHIRLSEMADSKAGLMVSVNSIIISIMTSFLVREFAANPKLLLPTILLVLVCLLTITFAMLSTKPSVKHQKNTEVDKLDLFFFGDYMRLSLSDYKKAMVEMMENDTELRESLIENIYAQGKVIDRKFKLLGTAYMIFMYGFPLAIICFLLILF
jgi:ABC-type multidrug transport system fused ATPase/permease subunit